ncbi:MAG TPA: cbb3-type cytochrome c oxidase subunit 3 [Vineibacter sp.]|nr:cbb3-type cytochrome c oxidase subunit 3 [Vineibacter sp.]
MSLTDLLPYAKSLWTGWFFLVFVGLLAWTMWPGRRSELETRGRIPLDEDLPLKGRRDGR